MQEKTVKQQNTADAAEPATHVAASGKHLLDALKETLMAATFHWWMTLCSLSLSGEYRAFAYFVSKTREAGDITGLAITLGSQICAAFCLTCAARDICRAIQLAFKKS